MKRLTVLFVLFVVTAVTAQDPITLAPSSDARRATYGLDTAVVAASDSSQLIKSRAGWVCDGTADEVQINEALASGVARVFLPSGNYTIAAPICPPNNVELAGAGMTQTIIWIGSSLSVEAITRRSEAPTPVAYRVSLASPATGIVMRDFKIDGTNAPLTNVGTATAGGAKGMFLKYYYDCLFENVWIHNTPSSGFGNDYGVNSIYRGCKATYCGRVCKVQDANESLVTDGGFEYGCRLTHTSTLATKPSGTVNGDMIWMPTGRTAAQSAAPAWAVSTAYTGSEPTGCSGFGLGMCGVNEKNQSLRLENCVAEYSFNDGITFEGVGDTNVVDPIGYGASIVNCTCMGNKYGIELADAAAANGNVWSVVVSGNTVFRNAKYGVTMKEMKHDVTVANNHIFENGDNGVAVGYSDSAGLKFLGNDVFNNGGGGLYLRGRGVVVEGNFVYGNQGDGIFFGANQGGNNAGAVINDNVVVNNGYHATTSWSAIKLSGAAATTLTYVNIQNNVAGNDRSKTYNINATYGIEDDGSFLYISTDLDAGMLGPGMYVTVAGTTNFNGSYLLLKRVGARRFIAATTGSAIAKETAGTVALRTGYGSRTGVQINTTNGPVSSVVVTGNNIFGANTRPIEVVSTNYATLLIKNNLGDTGYTISATGTVQPFELVNLSAASADVAATVADGVYVNQTMLIRCTNASNAATAVVTHHILGDNKTYTFSANGVLTLIWDGADWHTLYAAGATTP